MNTNDGGPAVDWVILVGGGYGAFLFSGTEQEAEDMRAHKARWEHAPAWKRHATADEVASRTPSQCLNHPSFGNRAVFVDCTCQDEDCVANATERSRQR